MIFRIVSYLFVVAASAVIGIGTGQAQTITPKPNWADSYSVNGKCYCATTFDHGIGEYPVDTPAGTKTVRQVCAAIGPGPGKGSNPVYNTVHCGHEPAHDDAINIGGRPVKDEKVCPGRVDQGSGGCQTKGPLWDLSVFDNGGGSSGGSSSGGSSSGGGPAPHAIPGKFEAEDFSSQSGTRLVSGTDSSGGDVIGFIENGDYLEFGIDVGESATYQVDLRIASGTGGSTIEMSADGAVVGSVRVPDTGGFKTWQTVSTQVKLSTSQRTLRLTFKGGGGYLVDVNWLAFDTDTVPADPVEISVQDISVNESDGTAPVTISLSRAADTDVEVLAFTRMNGSAVGGRDYYGFTRKLTIRAGETSTVLPVTLIRDSVSESTETFYILLTSPVGAQLGDSKATVTITDNTNALPTLSIESVTVSEDDGEATLTVRLSEPADASVTVFTRGGTATGGRDYYGFTKKLNFSGANTELTVSLILIDDTQSESREALTVHLVGATGALIGASPGTVTINDDDTAPPPPGSSDCVVIEAESLPLTGAWSRRNDNGASGGSYITWEGLSRERNNNSPADTMSTRFQVSRAGTYNFIWSMRQPDGVAGDKANDSWLNFPDAARFGPTSGGSYGGFVKVYGRGTGQFAWSARADQNHVHSNIAVVFNQPGTYTLQVAGRSHGHQIDEIIVHHESVERRDCQ